MKTPIIVLSGIVAVLSAFTAIPAMAEPAYATRNVNVRSGPGFSYETVGKLAVDQAVDKGSCNPAGTWCYVRYTGGSNGWVAATFLSDTAPGQQNPPSSGEDNAYKALRTVNVRSGPGTNFDIVDRLSAGEAVTRGQCVDNGSWCYVTHEGSDGWVSASFLAPVNPEPPPVDEPSGGLGDDIRFAISAVNVRTGPSTDYAIVDRLARSERVTVAQCTSDRTWCYVDHDGPDGWVSANYLRKLGGSNPGNQNPGNQGQGNQGQGGNQQQMVTQKIGTAIAGMPVRNAPTLFTSTIGHLNQGDTARILQCSDDGYWCQVKNDAIAGWVPAAFLTVSEIQVPAEVPGNLAVTAQATKLYRMPGGNSQVLATVPSGTNVTVARCGPAGNWCQTSYNGATGWLAASDLKPPASAPAQPAGQQPNSVCITGFGGLQFCLSQ